MSVEFKHITYNEPVENDEQRFTLIKSRNYTAFYPTCSNFVYDVQTKTIYDAIYCDVYRNVRHELILSDNGFNFKSIEPDNFIRFDFNTDGCFNLKCNYTGIYTFNELGIAGLHFSGLYYDFAKYKKRSNQLKVYDLNIIESYVEYLKEEQEHIRQTEMNLNLRKTPRRHKRRQFGV